MRLAVGIDVTNVERAIGVGVGRELSDNGGVVDGSFLFVGENERIHGDRVDAACGIQPTVFGGNSDGEFFILTFCKREVDGVADIALCVGHDRGKKRIDGVAAAVVEHDGVRIHLNRGEAVGFVGYLKRTNRVLAAENEIFLQAGGRDQYLQIDAGKKIPVPTLLNHLVQLKEFSVFVSGLLLLGQLQAAFIGVEISPGKRMLSLDGKHLISLGLFGQTDLLVALFIGVFRGVILGRGQGSLVSGRSAVRLYLPILCRGRRCVCCSRL